MRDGWYVTGDIGTIDEDGFIRLTDRLSRFAKIAGEMVPFGRIEEAASAILDDPNCVVAAVEDAERGERLVLMYVKPEVSPEELWARLNDSDLPEALGAEAGERLPHRVRAGARGPARSICAR